MNWKQRYSSEEPFHLNEWNNRFNQSTIKNPFYLHDIAGNQRNPKNKWMTVGDAYNGEWTPTGATAGTMTYEHPDLHENDQYIHAHENGRWSHGNWNHPEMTVHGQSENQQQAMEHALKSFKSLNPRFEE